MPTLADIYSTIDSLKRRGSDFAANPLTSLQQMVGYANDRAGNLNEMTRAATQETVQSGSMLGPQNQRLMNQLSEAYNPMGMVSPMTNGLKVLNPAELQARQAIDNLIKQARYFGVDVPIDHTKLPIGVVLGHLDEHLGTSPQVGMLPDAAKESLRNLWMKAENSANAYKRVYGENKLMGKREEAANSQSVSGKAPWYDPELEDRYLRGEISQSKYEKQGLKNMENYFKKK